ncbi:putative glycoside hydrolase [Pontiellaceae bacterium B12227]|nr:putative glycoside hydrolase [Pontiellaceae bacterium B12227]
MVGTLLAATVHWTGGANSSDWNDATSWSTAYVPGSIEADTVLFVGTADSTTLVTPFVFTNSSTMNLRGEPMVTLSADLSGVNSFLLGGNNNNDGGTVHQTGGALSAVTVRVGSIAGATTESAYTISGGRIANSGNLYVNKGTFTLSGSSAEVEADSMTVTGIGTLAFVLGSDGVIPISVTNAFTINDSTSKLSIDASAYTTTNSVVELVHFGSLSGSFATSEISITGLPADQAGTIVYDDNRLTLELGAAPPADSNIEWDNEAIVNIGWHTAANWENDMLPGSVTNQNAILDGMADAPYVVQSFNPANPFDITVRNEAVLTIEADLLNVDDFYLGPNAGNGGGVVNHSSGTVAAKQVRVGGSATAASDSDYTLSGDAELVTTTDLYVGMGTFRIDGSVATVTVGNNLNLSAGGNVTLELGEYAPAPFDVAGAMSINASDSVLTVDGSFYRGGSGHFELIRFGGISGAFATTNVVIKGFKANQSASVLFDADSLDLIISTDAVADLDSQLWFSMTPPAGTISAGPSDLLLNNEHHASTLASPDLTCVQTTDGNDLIYTVGWTGNDFDADGSEDTITFDLRVKAYTGTSFNYSADPASSSIVGLGSAGDVTEDNGRWGVGTDIDLDEGESLHFQVENVQISVENYTAEIDGFTAFGLNEVAGNTHKHIRGEGIGSNLDSGVVSVPENYTFSPLNPLMVTCAGTATHIGFQIDSIEFSLNVHNPDLDPVWDPSDYSYMKDGVGYIEPYPEQAPGVDFPEFSWDKVPRWLAVRNLNAYSAEQISTIASNYQLVMLEKSNRNGLTYTEEGQLKMAADLKAVSPEIKVITYWNSGLHYTDFEADLTYDLETWSLKKVDSDGAVTYELQRGTQYKYDHSNADLRDWWVNVALTMASDENVDGVFIDVPKASNPHFYDENGDPQTDSTLMYDALRAGMPANKMLVGNSLRVSDANGHRQSMECFDGSYLENWHYTYGYFESLDDDHTEGDIIGTSIQLMREAVARGKMINMNSGPDGPGIEDDPAPAGSANMAARRAYAEKYVDFPLAVFLIAAETNAYFCYNMGPNAIEESYNDDVWDASFIPALNRPLGAPLGDPTRDGYIYTRSFEHVDVWLDVDSKETVFAWDSVDADADGLNDLWEYRNFGNITNAVPTENPDGDAYTNTEEYIAGLNPNVFDTFNISNFTVGTSNTFEWNAVSGRIYNVYWSSNLVDGFTQIESNITDGMFIDTEHAGDPAGFYKITVELDQ